MLSILTPNSFSLFDNCIFSFEIFRSGGFSIILFAAFLVEINMALVLGILSILFFLHQSSKFSKSSFKRLVRS